MALYSNQLRTAVLLLALVLTKVGQSAPNRSGQIMQEMKEMKEQGQTVLAHLESEADLKTSNSAHEVRCIVEPKAMDVLHCGLLADFHELFDKAAKLRVEAKLTEGLEAIMQQIQNLQENLCSNTNKRLSCEAPAGLNSDHLKRLEEIRSLLVLYTLWMDKTPKNRMD